MGEELSQFIDLIMSKTDVEPESDNFRVLKITLFLFEHTKPYISNKQGSSLMMMPYNDYYKISHEYRYSGNSAPDDLNDIKITLNDLKADTILPSLSSEGKIYNGVLRWLK